MTAVQVQNAPDLDLYDDSVEEIDVDRVYGAIAQTGHATRAQQLQLLSICVTDRCVEELLDRLVEVGGIPVRDIITDIKCRGGHPGHPRRSALRLARHTPHASL